MKISTLIRLLEDINNNESMLTDWERKFVDDIDKRAGWAIKRSQPFTTTAKKDAVIWRIHARVTLGG